MPCCSACCGEPAMSEAQDRPVVLRSAAMDVIPTRRAGIGERRLLGPELSEQQNLVLIDAEQGAEVELHEVPNSESFFVLEGELLVSGPEWEEVLKPGDLCYFQPGMEHAVRVTRGPARFLVVFAPSRSGPAGD